MLPIGRKDIKMRDKEIKQLLKEIRILERSEIYDELAPDLSDEELKELKSILR